MVEYNHHGKHMTPDTRLAHDLNDATKLRSKDVVLEENVTFEDLNLSEKTLLGLQRCGFERPSPIQLASLPLGRCGFDLVVQSKAGTGKTCIFAVIALEALLSNCAERNTYCQTLIIAPTREIATQTHEVISSIGSSINKFRCALCIGGVEVKRDRATLLNSQNEGACNIVIGTPGRLKQLIELNILKTQLIELLVLDEADKLMEEQFKNQIDEIYKRLPDDKQMVVTSATYPDELAEFLQQYMRAPKSVRLGQNLTLEALVENYVESKAGHSAKKTLDNKFSCLKSLLNQIDFCKCLIFTNYQARAPLICEYLNGDADFLKTFGPTNYICAELSQPDRNSVFNNFKHSNQKLLVSTDISARGIDIQDIDLVINLDLPNDKSTYYHRIGRAGRFGQPGKAISIVSNDSLDRTTFAKNILSDKLVEIDLSQINTTSSI